MRDGQGARFLFRLSKPGRNRNTGITVTSQDAADLLATDLGLAVVSNAATQILLRQAPQAIDTVSDAFALTDGERRMLLTAQRGHGLLLSGTNRTQFEAVASPRQHDLATTNPADLIDEDRLLVAEVVQVPPARGSQDVERRGGEFWFERQGLKAGQDAVPAEDGHEPRQTTRRDRTFARLRREDCSPRRSPPC
jgi:hypothetical protein